MINYKLFNEIIIKETVEIINIENEKMIEETFNEIIINNSVKLLKYLINNRPIAEDFYEVHYTVIKNLEHEYNDNFDNIFIDDNVLNLIKETIEEFIEE